MYRDRLLHGILQGTKDADELVRASAVSNLAELAKMLKFALGPIIHEVRTMYTRNMDESEAVLNLLSQRSCFYTLL